MIGKVVEKSGIVWYNRFMRAVNLPDKSEFIKEDMDEIVFMFALFKCRKFDKRRN